MPPGREGVTTASEAGFETVKERFLLATAPTLSVTVKERLVVPALRGIPLIVPVEENPIPAGRVPDVRTQV
jgi:hypothetical protein